MSGIVTSTGKKVMKVKSVNTKPTDIDALASQLIQALESHIDKRNGPSILHIGTVTDIDAGPPTTLTVLIQGHEYANIRTVAPEPEVDDEVIVLLHRQTYICVGLLVP